MNRWKSKGVPHKNWFIVDQLDMGHGSTITCEMCGTQEVRYVHIMDHNNYKRLAVGCVCAENMSISYKGKGKEAERQLRLNAAKEKRNARPKPSTSP